MLEDLKRQQIIRIAAARRRRRKIFFMCICCCIIFITIAGVWIVRDQDRLETTVYEINSDKLSQDLTIVLMSDLHNKEFGTNNSELVQAVKNAQPDMIIMCGDMVMQDDPDVSVILELCGQLKEEADIYYVLGNHEGVLEYAPNGLQVPLDQYLWEMGVTVCYPGAISIPAGESQIQLFSVSMDEDDYRGDVKLNQAMEAFARSDDFKIVVSHYPAMIYNTLYDVDFDLATAGHYHGGQVIIPGLGGLYHMDTGFFPEYYGGLYQLGKGKLVVTRGLGDSSGLPRINNRPELAVIKIRK